MAALIFAPSWLGLDNGLLDQNVSNPEQLEMEQNIPEKTGESLGVKITAGSGLVIDKETGHVLFSKNPHEVRAMASTTKVMTTLVALESGKDLEEVITVNEKAVGLEGAKIKLLKDERLPFKELVRGAMISSGNDAALATALHVADGDEQKFVEMMNTKATELGLENTQFKNPHGLDAPGHHSTAKDLAKLLSAALEYDSFREMISTERDEVAAVNADTTHVFKNTNKLLDSAYPYMKGGKTGFTDNAGFCLVALSEKDGKEVISVVLGSDLNGNQFQDTKAMVEWTFMNYSWK